MSDDLQNLLDAWGRAEASGRAAPADASRAPAFLGVVRRARLVRAWAKAGAVVAAGILLLIVVLWVVRPQAGPAPAPEPERPLRAIDR